MTEYDRIKILGIAGFILTLCFGEIAFYIFLFGTLLHSLFRPASYLVLLFFSGLLKNSSAIESLPIDFTLLTFLLFTCYFFHQIATFRVIHRNAIAVSALIVMAFGSVTVSLLLTPASWDYISNSGIYIVILYLPLLFMIVALPPETRWKVLTEFQKLSLLIAYAWIGLGLHNEAIGYFPPQLSNPVYPVDHLSAFGEDYMVFSTFIVLVFSDAIVQFLYTRHQPLNGCLILVLTYALVNSPARGLTVGLVGAGILLLFIWFRRFSIQKIFLFGFLSFGLLSFIVYYVQRFSEGNKNYLISRLVDFDPSGTSISHRITSVVVAFQHWRDQPWFGTGTDSVAWFNRDPGYYSHNLILEILFEYGILGGLPLFCLLALLFLSFYEIVKNYMITHKDIPMLWFGALFVIFFGFGMFSGTLGNMRLLWILMGMTIGFGVIENSSERRVL